MGNQKPHSLLQLPTAPQQTANSTKVQNTSEETPHLQSIATTWVFPSLHK